MSLKKVIAIIGTTGVGKTKLSIELAKLLDTEVINVDAMQMYKGYDIITNKATLEERKDVKHHLIDFVDINKEYTIKDFEIEALDKINTLHKNNKVPILVGGTFYYLQSILFKSTLIEEPLLENKSIEIQNRLKELNTKWNLLTNQQLFEELKNIDPVMAEHWHFNDRRRVLRSLQIFYETGKLQSDHIKDRKMEKTLKFETLLFWLVCNKPILNNRLDVRVDQMVKGGLIDEIHQLSRNLDKLPCGENEYDRGIKQAIGFKAFDSYIKNHKMGIEGEELEKDKLQCIEQMKIHTRQYAKKQINWIKNKLIPLYKDNKQNNQPIYLYDLNATNLDEWELQVGNRASFIIDEIFNHQRIPSEQSSLPEIASCFEDKKEEQDKWTNWKKRTCETCSLRIDKKNQKLVEPVIINGEQEWLAHINSKGHKKQVQFVKYKSLIPYKTIEK